jgi:large subunit ribosomal protein L18
MSEKKESRQRRARRSRAKIKDIGSARLCVHRTPRHMYAQIIASEGNTVIACASTLDKEFKAEKSGNVDAAKAVGALIAGRAKAAGVETVAFDRSGFKFHGRVKALADAAREAGLQF